MFRKNYILLLIINFFSIQLSYSQFQQNIDKAKDEYEQSKQKRYEMDDSENGELNIESTYPKKVLITKNKSLVDSLEFKKINKFFGYNFFTKRDTTSFWENLPAPPNYILGPGDEIVVSIWGETQLRKTFIISRDGKIYDEKVGLMNIMGKDIEDLKKYLSVRFGSIYSSLKGENPTAFLDISLGQIRSINVNFVGEIKYPGVYPIHPFSTLITGIIQAGGIDTTGTLRNIIIKRNGNVFANVDLYNYILKGDLPNNIQLRDQDIIIVPVRLNTIKIDSCVIRPGIYEANKNETIKDMINYAGGLKYNASANISLNRIIPIKNRKSFDGEYFENYYINHSDSEDYIAQNGDIIYPLSIFASKNVVEIIGQVKKPGFYNYYKGMTLNELVKLGGGFNDTTFLKSVYNKAELVRRDPNGRYEKVFEVELDEILQNAEISNYQLNNLDRFVIHANRNFFERQSVMIKGEVNIPGAYPLIMDNEDLNSLIKRSGGLTSKALPDGIIIYRKNNKSKNNSNNYEIKDKETEINRVAWKNKKVILMPGDSIVVSEATQTVQVIGEVFNPGIIEFQEGKSIRYYLNSSGGVKNTGDKNGIIVIYPNGVIAPYRYYLSPKISDGATIVVNTKEFEEPFNITQFATNWTSIISSMITAVILSRQLGS